MAITKGKEQSARTERLEARLTAEQKAFLTRAAELEGRSLTDFVVHSAQEAAKQVIREHEAIMLGEQDRKAFVAALLEEAEPGDRLRRAAERYRNVQEA